MDQAIAITHPDVGLHLGVLRDRAILCFLPAVERCRRRRNNPIIKCKGRRRDKQTGTLASAALAGDLDICAVYSVGGGNRSLLDAFSQGNRSCQAFVAHDLDADNRALLAERRINFVLHHDLKTDVRNVYRLLLEQQRLLVPPKSPPLSEIGIFTPFNIPV